jgi:hypothetical protein
MWDTMSGAGGAVDRPNVRHGSKAAYVGGAYLAQARMRQPRASAAPPRMASCDRDQAYSEQHQRHVPGYAQELHGGVRQAAARGARRSQRCQLSVRASAPAYDAPPWRLGRGSRTARQTRGPQGDRKGRAQLLKSARVRQARSPRGRRHCSGAAAIAMQLGLAGREQVGIGRQGRGDDKVVLVVGGDQFRKAGSGSSPAWPFSSIARVRSADEPNSVHSHMSRLRLNTLVIRPRRPFLESSAGNATDRGGRWPGIQGRPSAAPSGAARFIGLSRSNS